MEQEDFFRVGVIANTHGIHGEVKVFPTTDDVTRFEWLEEVYLDIGPKKKKLEIAKVRYFKNMVILKFKDIDSINDIEKYKGQDLWVTRENALPLAEDEYYLSDILGAEVYTEEGEAFGVLEDILETGANLVYVVQHEGEEVLLPVIPDCVKDINVEEKRVIVSVLPGLLEK